MAIITTNNLHKVYDEGKVPVYALNGVDMTIEEGEFTSIVGPSGSGKTTLLNIIGGLDHPSEGNVIIDGEDITEFKDNKMIEYRLKHIGFVFQAFNLIPVLTALENVEFIMLLQKWSKKDRQARAKELLDAVVLSDKLHKSPTDLSGGQHHRAAVARPLASKPRFTPADEPTASLDSKSTADLLDLMLNLNKQENATFIFSTHDQRVIDRARRVVTLEDGKIVEDEVRGEGS
jgi:putative ABC transport system ATP-binding protein